jgi:hypothetical protein
MDSKEHTIISEKHSLHFHGSSALKMETVCFHETLLSANESTRRHVPEQQHGRLHRRENIESHHLM